MTLPDVVDGPVAVLGCGLVGASVAAGLSEAGVEVWGADRRDLSPLVERGRLARQVDPDGVADAAVVVLALPPSGIVAALRRLPFRPGQLVTDVGSVKAPMLDAAAALPPGVDYVGGHPMAGGTTSGFEEARADLFRGAVWVLAAEADEEPRERVAGLARALGAEPLVVESARHDRLVALTSHLPQLLSTALAAELEAVGEPELVGKLLGPGGRGFLRLAESPFDLWRDIFHLNEIEVSRALAAVAARAGQPAQGLAEEFAAARRLFEA